MPSTPNPARDPRGTLPPAGEASRRSERVVDQRAILECRQGEVVQVGPAQWIWVGTEVWRGLGEEKGPRVDVGSDVPGGGAA